MSDPTEGAATPTLEESLAAGFDAETPDEPSSTTATATAPSDPAPASGEPNAVLNPLEPPKHWAEVDRTIFSKAPRDIQERWIAREQDYARGFDQKAQEAAKFKKIHDAYDELLQPYKNDLQMQGMEPVQFFKSLLGWQQYLNQNPRDGLLRLAQAYGVEPQALLEQQTQVDPNFAKLQQELAQVKNQFTGFVSEAQQREHQANLSKVTMFADEKGPDGKPSHPYFDEVSGDILNLMKAQPGIALETAYQKALRMNDEIWEKVQADKAANASKQADAERMAAVEKAKKAAVSTGTTNAKGATRTLSLEEDLRARFEGTN
jgi:hypothetical protein